MKIYFLALLLAFSFTAQISAAQSSRVQSLAQSQAQAPFERFYTIAPDLYRGARPEVSGLKFLAQLGVRTILNLDNDMTAVRAEIAEAKKLGIKVISIPLSSFFAPSDSDIDKALEIMSDGSQGPLFVHCKHGEDRTGLVVALYRIEVQNWRATTAREEMLKNGFHKILLGLNHYFEQRSGLED